jgi:hypothetical protein
MHKRQRLLGTVLVIVGLAGCSKPTVSVSPATLRAEYDSNGARHTTEVHASAPQTNSSSSQPSPATSQEIRPKKPPKPKKTKPDRSAPNSIHWFTDYAEALQQARTTGKPLFVVFR